MICVGKCVEERVRLRYAVCGRVSCRMLYGCGGVRLRYDICG